jgi:regulatory protein
MKEIDEETYHQKLQDLATKKYASLNGEQYLIRKKKTMDYLLQKGYEPELISGVLSKLKTNE